MHPRDFVIDLCAVERAGSAVTLGCLRAALLERLDLITPDRRTLHLLAQINQRERNLVAVDALVVGIAGHDAA